MKRIAPSERMRKELEEVMNGGNREGFLMSEIIRKGGGAGTAGDVGARGDRVFGKEAL